ncbi:carcinoembryonic antigen-related cell adhesion molecule 1 [Danio aesculapii]|uniref:carcinoembryonic antigen-related cell adhesion molecule 1 n=1 Tax=Danio aesculapii TaxID=1142201 RepID=UPI0024C00F1C|nr:carcinoembryonic antigen-related cell adhesion molecule 1 [Danio aesculapii]
MMQHSLLLWIVLLVGGVFGDEYVPVSVMEGDSVTLISNITKLQKNEGLNWYINDATIIAKIDEDTQRSSVEEKEENLKSRLELNESTGSLTIINISKNDSRDYKLQTTGKIKGNPKIFKVIVNGVPIVEKNGVKSVSVMKGDSVTLHTGVTQKDGVMWTFQNSDLTHNQTGDLTITNIGNRQSGNYDLEINTSRLSLRRTYLVVLIGEKPRVSVKKGESVFLSTGVKDIQTFDLMLWIFEGRTIAEINKRGNSIYDSRDGRLQMNDKSGSLIISNSASTDAGDYNLIINSSTQSLQRTISVTVSNLGVFPGAEAGIVVGLLVFLWCLQL